MTTNYFEKYDLEDFEEDIFKGLQAKVPKLEPLPLIDLLQATAEDYQEAVLQDGYEAAVLELVRTELLKRLEAKQ